MIFSFDILFISWNDLGKIIDNLKNDAIKVGLTPFIHENTDTRIVIELTNG